MARIHDDLGISRAQEGAWRAFVVQLDFLDACTARLDARCEGYAPASLVGALEEEVADLRDRLEAMMALKPSLERLCAALSERQRVRAARLLRNYLCGSLAETTPAHPLWHVHGAAAVVRPFSTSHAG